MNTLKAILASVMLVSTTSASAGGILTNTNQSIDFLRNPARDAAIGLDGVYSNPAGKFVFEHCRNMQKSMKSFMNFIVKVFDYYL